MEKILKYTYAGNPTSPYFKPIEQTIVCSDTETFPNGCYKPLDSKWHATVQAMDSNGVLILSSGDKYEVL